LRLRLLWKHEYGLFIVTKLLELELQKEVWEKPLPKNEIPAVPEDVVHPDVEPSSATTLPLNGTNEWEIDYNQLKFNQKLANGSFGEL